jgi:hypothetical protein
MRDAGDKIKPQRNSRSIELSHFRSKKKKLKREVKSVAETYRERLWIRY